MDSVFDIVVAMGLIVGAIAAVLIWRARKPIKLPSPCCAAQEEPQKEEAGFSARAWLAKLWAAIDYLRTRREWRYKAPWVLLLGEPGAGKSSLIASASSEHRQTAPSRRDELKVDGTDWQFFDQGVLIDPEGKLPAAASGSPQAKEWARVLREIEALRPERALDGLLLTVSTRSLLNASAGQRLALAENAYRQLCDIQQHFEFVLPVYVVVTNCDAVDGFSAFWEAQPAERRKEIFGWSAPAQLASATPIQWADSTFDTLAEQLKALQLDAAAQSDRIADADHFFLFPRHFQQLREPLKQWLATVFQPSAWHPGFLCRGVYFTGSVAADGARTEGLRKDVAFVDDLIAHKVLAERHLAYPTRQGIWSRNRLIRSMQIAGITAFCGLAVALGVAAFQMNRQVDALISSLTLLQEINISPERGEACINQDRVYQLLEQVSHIDANSVYWSIPVSWIDARASRRSARLIANAAFQRVILPSLSCRLEMRARQLVAYSPQVQEGDMRGADAYAQSRQSLFDFLQSVQKLELNIAHFRRIAAYASQSEADSLMRTFAELAEYAYGSPLPKAVAQQHGALSAALTYVKYGTELQLPAQMQQRFMRQIVPMAARLRNEFEREVGIGGNLLAQLDKSQEPVLTATRHFTRWLGWTRESWLGSSVKNNPCEKLRNELNRQVQPLVKQYGYPNALEEIGRQFGTEQCYKPSMRTLTTLQLAPYGPLFTSTAEALDLNPKLQPELAGLTTLSTLDFMQMSNTRPFACLTSDSGWRVADIAQATNYLREYEDFARKQGLPAIDTDAAERPLYDRLARYQLERVLNSTMRNAQAPDPARQPVQQVNLQATSLADQQLTRESANFSKSLEPLLGVLRMYVQNRFDVSRARITQCIRDYAADNLGHIDALAGVSRLYDPSAGSDDASFFNLGSTPVTIDYLARQVSRSQVLAGYAAPFVSFLQNTDAVNDAQRANAQTAPYWNNTITELNRYVQFKEPAGQVAQLHNLFLKQFADLDNANCSETLAAYEPPAYSNDMFSQRRQHLEEQAQWRCTDSRKAQAYEAWRELSTRFNRELAGRYPFAEPGARDASPATVKAFFTDYAGQSAALRQSLAGLSGARWNAARRFLDQLDAVSAFFAANLTAGDLSRPVKLNILFRAQPTASPGSEQVVSWSLSAGTQSTGYPNRPNTLDWPYGQPLVLDLMWADRSLWRPAADLQQPGLQVDGASASFAAAGEWALLRLIDAHRPQTGQAADPLDPSRVLLEFTVPVVAADNQPGKAATATARLYLALNLAGKDPKTQAPLALTLPAAFPRSAPQ